MRRLLKTKNLQTKDNYVSMMVFKLGLLRIRIVLILKTTFLRLIY